MTRRLLLLLLIGLTAPVFAATGTITPSPFQTVIDNNGNPINLACVWTYVAGTTTPSTTYTDVGLTTPNTNPIIVGPSGRYTAFLTPGSSYKYVYESPPCSAVSHGSTILTADNIVATPASSASLDVLGTAGEAITAGDAVYLSDGSGAKTAGQWYKADADQDYSSTRPLIGLAPNAIASAGTGTIRLGGQVSNLAGLTLGGSYYVSATAGAITSTAPTSPRLVGVADSATDLIVSANPPPRTQLALGLNEFRLTLTTATPVTTGDVTAATTVYLTPYKGNRIALYDASSNPTYYTSAEISIAVPAAANQMYDIFVYGNATGAPQLELLAWTNDTTRATAVINTAVPGVYTKSGDTTRRYVGAFRTTGVAGQTEDSMTKRYLSNYYNRVIRVLRRLEATDTWPYTTATIRQANGSTANQLDVVVGIAEVALKAHVTVGWSNNGAAGSMTAMVGIGEDSTTVISTATTGRSTITPGANLSQQAEADLMVYPAIGRHFYAWLEYSAAAGITTWIGDNGGTFWQSGIFGWIEG